SRTTDRPPLNRWDRPRPYHAGSGRVSLPPVSFAPARAAPFGRAPVTAPEDRRDGAAIIPREARRQRRRGTAASAADPCAAPADCERSAARTSCPRAPLPALRGKSRTGGPTTAD